MECQLKTGPQIVPLFAKRIAPRDTTSTSRISRASAGLGGVGTQELQKPQAAKTILDSRTDPDLSSVWLFCHSGSPLPTRRRVTSKPSPSARATRDPKTNDSSRNALSDRTLRGLNSNGANRRKARSLNSCSTFGKKDLRSKQKRDESRKPPPTRSKGESSCPMRMETLTLRMGSRLPLALGWVLPTHPPDHRLLPSPNVNWST